jgi:hypothetical protein
VLLLIASETGQVYTFATSRLQPLITKPEGKNLIQACLNFPERLESDPSATDTTSDSLSSSYPQSHSQAHHHPSNSYSSITSHCDELVGSYGSSNHESANVAASMPPVLYPQYLNPSNIPVQQQTLSNQPTQAMAFFYPVNTGYLPQSAAAMPHPAHWPPTTVPVGQSSVYNPSMTSVNVPMPQSSQPLGNGAQYGNQTGNMQQHD